MVEINFEESIDFTFFNWDGGYQSIWRKVSEDLRSNGMEITYKNFITVYNTLLSGLNISIDNFVDSVVTLIGRTQYDTPDKDTKYLKTLSEVLLMKYILSKIEKVKEVMSKKLQWIFDEALSEKNRKWKYSELLRSNIYALNYTNEEWNARGSPFFPAECTKGNISIKKAPLYGTEDRSCEKFMSFAFPNKDLPSDLSSLRESPQFKKKLDSPEQNKATSNENLTKSVWPKSTTLLSIISKMYAECHIGREQRGILKEMILEHDIGLKQILNDYEISRDRDILFQSIIEYSKKKMEPF